jgi:hypothetical protein
MIGGAASGCATLLQCCRWFSACHACQGKGCEHLLIQQFWINPAIMEHGRFKSPRVVQSTILSWCLVLLQARGIITVQWLDTVRSNFFAAEQAVSQQLQPQVTANAKDDEAMILAAGMPSSRGTVRTCVWGS